MESLKYQKTCTYFGKSVTFLFRIQPETVAINGLQKDFVVLVCFKTTDVFDELQEQECHHCYWMCIINIDNL